MPVISVNSEDLLELTGSDEVTLLEVLPKLGIEVEAIEGDSWELEVDPNRCDMLSVEGIARSVRGFLGKETGLPTFGVSSSDIKTEVDLSVQEIRPYIVTALVKDVDISQRDLKSLMDLQEKLHVTIGRERSKVAIGLHDFGLIEPPITYKAVKPEEVSFVPLGRSIEMNLQEILEKHDKGKEFRHILNGKKKYPVIVDSKENVLSFPPIINGELTQATPDTDSFFIDMTGTDMEAIEQTLNIFCTSLAERDAEIYTTEVNYGSRSIIYPDLGSSALRISRSECEDLLGVEISEQEMKDVLERMRYSVGSTGDEFEVEVPPYRHDILHPWDVVEDVAIGYDYDNFSGCLPENVTIGSPLPEAELKKAVTELLIGYGFTEAMNYMLSDPKIEFEMMNIDRKETAEVKNPVSEERTSLRTWLLPGLLSNLKKNRTESLPQKLFEIGDVVVESQQKTKIGGVIESSSVGFTEMKSMMDGFLNGLGLNMQVESKEHGSFIEGRCASIIEGGTEIGLFGEISPKVLENFELENPTVGFELDFEGIHVKKSDQ